MKAHCLFEQSGTFKNEFKKLGIEAYDYDILNDFNETDYVINLFDEIDKAFEGGRASLIIFQMRILSLLFFLVSDLKQVYYFHSVGRIRLLRNGMIYKKLSTT